MPFTAPTAAEILARLAIDHAFATVVAEFVAAELALTTTVPASYEQHVADSLRLTDARDALVQAVPGAGSTRAAAIKARVALCNAAARAA